MCGKASYKLEWGFPNTNEKRELPLNDLSIALAYRDKFTAVGMQNVRVWSEWNQGYISPKVDENQNNGLSGDYEGDE